MGLENTECSPRGLRALRLLRFCTPNGCWGTALSLSSCIILPSRGVQMQAWLFWKHSALFCIKDLRKKTNALRQRCKSECWDRTAVHNQCLNRIWETGCSGITFLLAATISGHTHAEQRGMQPSLCVVLLTHFFQNTQITFTFVSFLPPHLRYKSFWCGMRASVQCNSGKICLIRSCCSCFANGNVFSLNPYCILGKRDPMPQVKWINVL